MKLATLRVLTRRWLRTTRRRLLVAVRRRFFRIDEDDIRDMEMGGLRRDQDAMAIALAEAIGNIRSLTERLEFYESNSPHLARLKRRLEAAKVEAKGRKLHPEAAAVLASAATEASARISRARALADGVLEIPKLEAVG